jgi:hypothetical protein
MAVKTRIVLVLSLALIALAGLVAAAGAAPAAPAGPSDLAIAARVIGVSEATLASAVKGGQTIAQVAQRRGVRPAAVIDAVVNATMARAQTRPDWAKMTGVQRARLAEQTRARITLWVNNTGSLLGERGAPPAASSELDAAARAIGVSPADLAAVLRRGQSVAQVAQGRGVRPAVVIEAVVSAVLAREQAGPDWPKMTPEWRSRFIERTRTRIAAWVNNTPGRSGETGAPATAPGELDVAARAIGITSADLIAAVRKGQSIAQVAEAHGVRPAAVIDAVVNDALARAQTRPDWAKMTDAERAQFAGRTRERVTAWVQRVETGSTGEGIR